MPLRSSAPALPEDAAWAAALLAIDPVGLGGASVRAHAGPLRDTWLSLLAALLPKPAPWKRVPVNIGSERLLGGLDLAATLSAGRPVAQRGLLAEADGGVVVLAMAERLPAHTAALVALAQDQQRVAVERDGLSLQSPCRFGVVALDEGQDEDEITPTRLLERMAFWVRLLPTPASTTRDLAAAADACTAEEIVAARARLPRVQASDSSVQALCAAAWALGIASVRAPMLAVRAACAAAALGGRLKVDEDDCALAARLVLAPRATRLPPSPEPPADEAPELPPEPPESPPPPEPESSDAQQEPPTEEDVDAKKQPPPPPGLPERPLDDVVLEAARAAIPAGLLDMLQAGLSSMARGQTAGRSGQLTQGRLRGRPSGVQRGEPRGGARINVIETLRAAAPWQALRRRELAQKAARMPVSETAGTSTTPIALESARRPMSRVQVRKEDFHITRFKQRSETATLFVVDASGSSALNRLAEAKGAVELLLADCYVRRDSVAVVAFRGKGAELLLPPTRSLVRAKRSLASLPGGGGTPLATAIDTVGLLALGIRRKGATPVIVMLTDGRGNIARDGSAGRPKAMEDAHQAALQLRAGGFQTLLLDTSPQPQAPARQLALAMGATYLPLPYAGAAALSQAVRAASRPTGQAGQAG